MRHAWKIGLGVGLAVLVSTTAPACAHPGGHDEPGHTHADPASMRLWTSVRTGESVRAAFLSSNIANGVIRVSLERDTGDVVAFALDDLSPADRAEAVRRIADVRVMNVVAQDPPLAKSAPGLPAQAAVFDAFAPHVKTRSDDRWLYIESDGLPHAPGTPKGSFDFSHTMMVGITAWQQQVPLPQAYTGRNAWQIPLKPELADKPVSAKENLFRGAIALAANGVPIFNPIKNDGRTDTKLAGELDEFGGHCGRADDYHYHIAPTHLQKFVGAGQPIAYALDGFPIYGHFDSGAKPGDERACALGAHEPLDWLNGHFAPAPAGSPPGAKGLYHYHASDRYPYLNGGMRGVVMIRDGQIDPQPRASSPRSALPPLRGATITGFKAAGKVTEPSWSLEYVLRGQPDRPGRVNYGLRDGQWSFEFVDPSGASRTETYDPARPERRPRGEGGGGDGGGGGGSDRDDRPRRREMPPAEEQPPRRDGLEAAPAPASAPVPVPVPAAGDDARSGPAWVTPAVDAPRVSHHVFDSAAAKAKVSYHLYTPAAYQREPERRFPVVYWLHGTGGGLQGVRPLARMVDAAIEAGTMPPALLVFVNGLPEGMYVDAKDGSAPVESMIVRDLVPHIDGAYRTIASPAGRVIDGFSMGGYGAARLGFKHPGVFGAVSMLGAGPMQEELVQTPRAGRQRAAEILAKVYGGDQAYFRAVSPRTLARENAKAIAERVLVRQVIGDKDETYANNVAFHEHLAGLRIPHEWTVLPGVGHEVTRMIVALGDRHWAFYAAAFARVSRDGAGGAAAPVPAPAGFTLTSPDVTDGRLSIDCTCDGQSRMPALAWGEPPAGTKVLAVVMHHVPPDGDTHVYLLAANLPATARSLDADAARAALWGQNTVNRRAEYAPPCSKGPGDKAYTITLYALSSELKPAAGSPLTRDALLAAIKDTTVGSTTMSVTYARAGAQGEQDRRDEPPPREPRGRDRGPRGDAGGRDGDGATGDDRRGLRARMTAFKTDVPDHALNVVLTRPTDRSMLVTVALGAAGQEGEVVVEYARQGAPTRTATAPVPLNKGEVARVELGGLEPDTNYVYRVGTRSRSSATDTAGAPREIAWGEESMFRTRRAALAAGKSTGAFTFVIQADSHLDQGVEPRVYEQTLKSMLDARPDFVIDLGDTFMTDKRGPEFTTALPQYDAQRYYFGLVARAAPLFMVLGNHDGEKGTSGTGADDVGPWSYRQRTTRFPEPLIDGTMYTGNTGIASGVGSNYYAFTWGDAQIIVLDPYWSTTERVRGGGGGGGGGGGRGTGGGDGGQKRPDDEPIKPTDASWAMTLGREQYDWLTRTLETSTSPHRFVFIHHLVGGVGGPEARGGAESSVYFEWGGRNADGSDGFKARRPGWPMPIHDLLVKHDVSAVFHGHDHLFVHAQRDGMTYQCVPQPGNPRGNTRTAASYGYRSGTILGSPGFVRVDVTPDAATVAFVPTQAEGAAREPRSHEYRLAPASRRAK